MRNKITIFHLAFAFSAGCLVTGYVRDLKAEKQELIAEIKHIETDPANHIDCIWSEFKQSGEFIDYLVTCENPDTAIMNRLLK